jgi:hypothetical protein
MSTVLNGKLASVIAIALALAAGGCGGTSSSSSTAPQTSSPPASESGSTGIPQNNRGDHDSDNSGGPSDGDGNL